MSRQFKWADFVTKISQFSWHLPYECNYPHSVVQVSPNQFSWTKNCYDLPSDPTQQLDPPSWFSRLYFWSAEFCPSCALFSPAIFKHTWREVVRVFFCVKMAELAAPLDEKNDGAITEDEAALYDRQIRLWGLDAQKRFVSGSGKMTFKSLYSIWIAQKHHFGDRVKLLNLMKALVVIRVAIS